MKFLKKVILFIFFLFPTLSFSHGNHGGGSVSIEDIFASPWHLHLPVEIGLDGSINYGYNTPWGDGHDHDDHDDHDNHDDHNDEGEHSSNWSIHPSIIFGGDHISRTLALDKVLSPSRSGEIEGTSGSKGFLVIKNTKITAGLGLDFDYHIPSIQAGLVGIGLSVTKGSSRYTEQFIDKLENKSSLKRLVAPKTIDDLKNWTNGDRLVLGVTGGVTFMSHVGVEPLVHAGPLFHVGGSWILKIKKLNHSKIELSLTNSKIKALAIETDGIFASAELERFKGQDQFMIFEIDLTSTNALIALEKLYKGDLTYAQNLSNQSTAGIVNIAKGKSLSKGNSRIFNLSIPFVFGASFSKSKITSYGSESNFSRNSKTQIYSSVASVESSTRGVLSNHKMSLKNFYATFADEWHVDHQHLSFGGTFKWLYEKDSVSEKNVLSKLKSLKKVTGMYKALEIKIPKRKLGYFRMEFDTNISNKDTLKIMGLPESSQLTISDLFVMIKSNSEKMIDNFFKSKNVRNLCKKLEKRDCLRRYKFRTKKALSKIQAISIHMKKLFKEKKYQEWTQSYAKWGSYLTTNQFVFKSVLQELKSTKYTLSVQGEKVATQKLRLKLN